VSYPLDLKSMTREEFQSLLDEVELHRVVGLAVESWDDDSITFSFAPPAGVRDPRTGGVHGGALATAIDTAAGFAATLACGFDIATIDLRLDYIRQRSIRSSAPSAGRSVPARVSAGRRRRSRR